MSHTTEALRAGLEISEIYFAEVGGVRRSVYRQLDGTMILADECTCDRGEPDWQCPIDWHAIQARQADVKG
jgi:hypothetical protein